MLRGATAPCRPAGRTPARRPNRRGGSSRRRAPGARDGSCRSSRRRERPGRACRARARWSLTTAFHSPPVYWAGVCTRGSKRSTTRSFKRLVQHAYVVGQVGNLSYVCFLQPRISTWSPLPLEHKCPHPSPRPAGRGHTACILQESGHCNEIIADGRGWKQGRVWPYILATGSHLSIGSGQRPGNSPSPGHRPGETIAFTHVFGPTGQRFAERLARWAEKQRFVAQFPRAMPWAWRTAPLRGNRNVARRPCRTQGWHRLGGRSDFVESVGTLRRTVRHRMPDLPWLSP